MIDFSIKNPLVVNLLLLLVVIMGVVSWQSMPEEMFPVVDKDAVRILTKFEGASPEEIEEQVTSPIEESLDNITKWRRGLIEDSFFNSIKSSINNTFWIARKSNNCSICVIPHIDI
mgnify:CR=1 FL=1